jgi:hypothetical protein
MIGRAVSHSRVFQKLGCEGSECRLRDIPGHGDLSTKADVLKFVDVLEDCVRLVDAARKAGKSLAQKAEGVLAKYDALGQGFVKTSDFIELIDNELNGETGHIDQGSATHH